MIYRILGQPEVTIFMGKTMISQWILRRYPPSFLRDKATSVYFSTPVGVTVVIVWLLLGLHPQSIFFKHGFSRSIIASLAAKKSQQHSCDRIFFCVYDGLVVQWGSSYLKTHHVNAHRTRLAATETSSDLGQGLRSWVSHQDDPSMICHSGAVPQKWIEWWRRNYYSNRMEVNFFTIVTIVTTIVTIETIVVGQKIIV